MDNLIARAQHRGQRRELERRTDQFLNSTSNKPKTRRAYIKWAIGVIAGSPSTVLLSVEKEGKGKDLRAVILEVGLENIAAKGLGRWIVTAWSITARDFSTQHKTLALDITDHIIERIMQRERIDSCIEAIEFLAPAIGISIGLMDHRDYKVLVPCPNGGALVMVEHSYLPRPWRALVTYVDNEKIRPEQRVVMEELLGYAKEKIRQINIKYADGKKNVGDKRDSWPIAVPGVPASS